MQEQETEANHCAVQPDRSSKYLKVFTLEKKQEKKIQGTVPMVIPVVG